MGGRAAQAIGFLVLGRGGDPYRMANAGALIGLPAFVLVISAAPLNLTWIFLIGNFLIGFGGALFGHGTLTATMNRAPRNQAGLALGAWGAVQATAAGVGMALSGTLRDLINAFLGAGPGPWGLPGSANGYLSVYLFEIGLLVITILATLPLIRRATAPGAGATLEPALAMESPPSTSLSADRPPHKTLLGRRARPLNMKDLAATFISREMFDIKLTPSARPAPSPQPLSHAGRGAQACQWLRHGS